MVQGSAGKGRKVEATVLSPRISMSEYERSVFRVYERCMDGMVAQREGEENANVKACRLMGYALAVLLAFSLFVVVHLHQTFAGAAGLNCLPELLAQSRAASGYYNESYLLNVSNTSTSQQLLASDEVLFIDVDRDVYIPAVGQAGLRGETEFDDRRRRLASIGVAAWVRTLSTTITVQSSTTEKATEESSGEDDVKDTGDDDNPNGTDFSNSTDEAINSSSSSSSSSSAIHDFKFAFDVGVFVLPSDVRKDHGFKSFNVTLGGSQCFGSAFTMGVLPMGGMDSIVMNMLSKTFEGKGGNLLAAQTGGYYAWSAEDLAPYTGLVEWANFKLGVLVATLLGFFLLSTISALLVRVLISSGVVLLFPFLKLVQSCGLVGFDMVRLMSAA